MDFLIIRSNLVYKAVAARFGIGKDFWINLFLTICGYIPGISFLHLYDQLPLIYRFTRPRPQLLYPGQCPAPLFTSFMIISAEHSKQQNSCPHTEMGPEVWPGRHFRDQTEGKEVPMGEEIQREVAPISLGGTTVGRRPGGSCFEYRSFHYGRRKASTRW